MYKYVLEGAHEWPLMPCFGSARAAQQWWALQLDAAEPAGEPAGAPAPTAAPPPAAVSVENEHDTHERMFDLNSSDEES